MNFFPQDKLQSEAIIDGEESYTFFDVQEAVKLKIKELDSIKPGVVVAIVGEYNFRSIVILVSLLLKKAIVVPLENLEEKRINTAGIEYVIDTKNEKIIKKLSPLKTQNLITEFRAHNTAGLIFFTSGTTGHEKAVLHDFDKLVAKISSPKNVLRTILFLKFNHLGGFNTLIKSWKSGGPVIVTNKRDPESVLSAVESGAATLLPVSSSFLSIMLFGGYFSKFDISSLRYISYGAEAVSSYVLKELSARLPSVTFIQTYGMTEIGVLKIKSNDSASSFMKIEDEGYEYRISAQGTLEIKPLNTSFVGYVDGDDSGIQDGWLDTKDMVEVDGDHIRIIGRKSDIINMRGEKFFPQEIEEVIIKHPDVRDVVVSTEKSEVFSEIVKAKIVVKEGVDCEKFISAIKIYCRDKMEFYKIPVKIEVSNELVFETIKKQRHE